ncbi:MAG: hypothetical protein ABJN04_13415 [Hyphomicrobiales bacterium]
MKHEKPPKSGTFKIALNKVATIKRPIQQVGDKTYSAISIPLEGENGDIINDPIIFDDTFQERYCDVGLEGHMPTSEAPFKLEVENLDQVDNGLSAAAYQKFVVEGEPLEKPNVCFNHMKDNIAHFVSFDGSFASQDKMSAMAACWAMSTYITPVLDTVGYIWPTGEKGSGKSQCMKTIIEMCYLGTTLTSSSTYASVRNQADLGATLGFDDCENIKGMDSSKRELLLAGNTKGVTASVQVPGGRDGEWKTRKIDAFAPRAFTSIGLPDATLGSRTIMVPLARTSDTEKTRRKPSNKKDWLFGPEYVRDVTWLNMVKYLSQIEAAKERVNNSSSVAGRDFDIFQGILSIAAWLETDHGEEGLLASMLEVMEQYLAQRDENVLPSLEELLLEALAESFRDIRGNTKRCPTSDIAEKITELCEAKDITDENLASVDAQRVGSLMRWLGFQKHSTNGSNRSWVIDRKLLEQHCNAHGIHIAPPMETPMPDWAFEENRTKWEEDITVPEDEKPW